jgi:hypothetical protein
MSSLKHYGTLHKSGRYPWGSGGDPEQRNKSFRENVKDLKKEGLSEADIAKGMGMKTGELRAKITIDKSSERTALYDKARKLKDKGYSDTAIGRQLGGMNESSVRSLLDPVIKERAERIFTTAKILEDAVAKKKYVDVGRGIENNLGITATKLKSAVHLLVEKGYTTHFVTVPQSSNKTGRKTSLLVLAGKDVTWKEVEANKDKIEMPTDHNIVDGGRSNLALKPIKNVDSKTIAIRYAEDGGGDKDGLIELRRGVDDLNLGQSRYAQVRIGVDDTHFLKGVAVYSDNIPEGKNIVYNTSKTKDVPPKAAPGMKEEVFKSMKDDPDNPFGALIKEGGQRGALNIIREEGGWSEWANRLSSQFLAKQKPDLIKQQLALTIKTKKEEFDEIKELTNPAVKAKLLREFADSCDGAAVNLDAAALPRQGNHLLVGFSHIKENEVYAPNYQNGEKVVLVRHPHGGIFELPVLEVNNRSTIIKKMLGSDAPDAIGVHPNVALQLSGADFDGDHVLVIPLPKGRPTITTGPALKSLMAFKPREEYPPTPTSTRMTKANTQTYMGKISNLITDMTLKGADEKEIARAVKHSMVVIDAEKHGLDYKKSAIDQGIASLKTKYQGGPNSGAATIISRAKSEQRVGDRYMEYTPDPKTGKKVWNYSGETYVDRKTGKVVPKTVVSTRMAEEDDARKLSSGLLKENIYADHANKLKSMANTARKEEMATPRIVYSPSANKAYAREVSSLKAQLGIALRNAPIERKALLFANKQVLVRKDANPGMKASEVKKIRGQALAEGRTRFSAKKIPIDITPNQWTAIQAGALSHNLVVQILNNAKPEQVKRLATPRTPAKLLSAGKLDKARAMKASGHTQADIAASLGVSTTALYKALND